MNPNTRLALINSNIIRGTYIHSKFMNFSAPGPVGRAGFRGMKGPDGVNGRNGKDGIPGHPGLNYQYPVKNDIIFR